MRLKKTAILLGLFFQIASVPAWGQHLPWGSWIIGTVQLPGKKDRWGGYAEAQIRMNGILSEFNYYEYKGGISYDLGKSFSLLLGFGRYHTYNSQNIDRGPLTVENRLWQQLTISQNLDRLKFEHRYRVEQRWLTHSDPIQEAILGRYRNRLRYRLNLLIPINKVDITAKSAFISIYNEVFLTTLGPHFERNRLYTGLGYQIDSQLVLQAGWINQFDYAPVRRFGKNNIVFTFLYRLHSRRESRLPTAID